MFSFLLVIIYISFISLGLPDSLLGSAWPVMYGELGVPLSHMGILSMLIAFCTIISSLMSDFVTKKLGTGVVTSVSVLMTAVALFGFSFTKSFILLCLWCVPYGLGAGAIDAALNNYVALHYASRHMNWLHCFWGVGASISPYIMGFCLARNNNWQGGYRLVALIQTVITIILFFFISKWKNSNVENKQSNSINIFRILKIKGVPFILVTFFCYCALESTAGLWASSFLSEYKNTPEQTAAKFASLFYLGITAGRFVCGFVSDKLGDKKLVRIGFVGLVTGILLVMLPLNTNLFALIGLIVMGVGCAPIYPSIIHSTPYNFGKENSQSVIGIQMASAYVGTTFMPPLFGIIADKISISCYPVYLFLFCVVMIVCFECLNKLVKNRVKN